MKALYLITLSVLISLAGCKKEKNQPAVTAFNKLITLPDSTVFVGGSLGDSTVIYALNGSSGALIARYGYRGGTSDWCLPFAGNNILYAARYNSFKALNIKTGAIMWTDSLKSYSSSRPILHDDTFYGAYASSSGSGFTIYALDATKQSNTFLWQYPLSTSGGVDFNNEYIKYYNGLVYIKGSSSLIALDAKTGMLKFTINASCSLSALNNGIIISGNSLIDATTGIQTFAAPLSLFVSNSNQSTSLAYVTENMFLTKVTNQIVGSSNSASTSTLNFYDRSTNLLKWSIDGGYSAFGYDTTKTINQIYNNQVIMKTAINIYTKDGTYSRISYSGYEINTGHLKWSYAAGYDGQTFTVGNMQYSAGAVIINNYYAPTPASVVAADLNTGTIRWSNNKLYINFLTYDATCLYTAGKSYASYIQ